MKITGLNGPLISLNGQKMKQGDKEIIFKEAVFELLLANEPNENMDGKDKYKLGDLAKRFYEADDEIELELEDVTKIKERVMKIGTTAIVKPICDKLEGK